MILPNPGAGTPAQPDYIGNVQGGFLSTATGAGAGEVFWQFTVDDSVLDALTAGEEITQKYSIGISDGTDTLAGQDLTITITGTNDAPVIESSASGFAVSDTADEQVGVTGDGVTDVTASGLIVFSDVDVGGVAGSTSADTHSTSVAFVEAVHERGASVLSTNTTTAVGSVTPGAISGTGTTGEHEFGWDFSVKDDQLDFLAAGDTLTVRYNITVTDSSGATNNNVVQQVEVVITGTNDVPTITSSEVNGTSLVEAGVGVVAVSEVSGDVSVSGNWVDVDTGEQALLAVTQGSHGGDAQAALTFDGSGVQGPDEMAGEASINGTYGWLYIQADGSYRYVLDDARAATQALDNEDTGVTETFNYTIANNGGGVGNEAVSTIQVSIEGSNDAPEITVSGGAASGSVTEAGVDGSNMAVSGTTTVSGTLGRTDVDEDDTASNDEWTVLVGAGQLEDGGSVLGTYGRLSIDANGQWTYVLDNTLSSTKALNADESQNDVFTVQLSDLDPANPGTDTQTIVGAGQLEDGGLGSGHLRAPEHRCEWAVDLAGGAADMLDVEDAAVTETLYGAGCR